MSTVKIRAGSLFRNPQPPIGAKSAAFRTGEAGFPHPSTGWGRPSQVVHKRRLDATCGFGEMGAKSIKHTSKVVWPS
ncbi:MAG TPA: hypothetical protein VGG14_19280 [Candidatus Sulfotelmatobacter sp.]